MIQHLNIALVCIPFAGSKFYHHSPKDNATCSKTVSFTEVSVIIEKRCISCNSSAEVYTMAPNGVVYYTTQDIVKMKEKIKQWVAIMKTMPQIKKTNIIPEERDLLRC